MNRAFLWPAALLGLAAFAAPTPAQYVPPGGLPTNPPGVDVSDFVQKVRAVAAPAGDMQEDVEILRRLLDGAFAEAYGFNVHRPPAPFVTFGNYNGANPNRGFSPYEKNTLGEQVPDHPAPHTEGVYLKDYGVVYTATLPLPPFSVLPGSNSGAATTPPPDDWDRVRKEIHGETPAPDAKPVPGHTPLSETILKVLADNGKHFGALADGDRITVAVTFRGTANCANCHQNPWTPAQPNNPGNPFGPRTFNGSWPSYPVLAQTAPETAPAATKVPADAAPPPSPGTPSWLTDVRNDVLLGDLHFKQGKTKEAIDAYENAVNQIRKSLPANDAPDHGLTATDVPALLTAVDVLNKLASAYVQAGNSGAAGKMLQEASDLAKKAEGLTGAPAPPSPQPSQPASQPLPAKLVVTASKKQLDDVGSGKITFEVFCKAATLDYVTPPSQEKK